MPKTITPLTDTKIKNAKPKEKQYTLFDGGGLHIIITPQGGKLWKLKYRFEGKEKRLSFGAYPTVPLAEARNKCLEAKRLLDKGIDPGEAKKEAQKAHEELVFNTFENIALEWHTKNSERIAESTSDKKLTMLKRFILPDIGSMPIKSIKASDILKMLEKLEARGIYETAKRVKVICGQVFNYAISTDRAENNPTAALKNALHPVEVKHYAAITDPVEAAGLMRAIYGYSGTLVVRNALKLSALFFVRPGEIRAAQWEDVDLEEKTWKYYISKTKTNHIVPLADQAVEILKELHLVTGNGKYVFPGARSAARPMSDNAINAALRRMGISKEEMTAHGFRTTARTLLDEVLRERQDFIEHQLAHSVKDPLGRAYNRTTHIEERRRMMQEWADYLDKLMEGGKIEPFKLKT